MGLDTPIGLDPHDYTPETVGRAITAAIRHGGWQEKDRRKDGDIAIFDGHHIGIYIRGRIVHCSRGSGVQATPLRNVLRRYPDLRLLR